MKRKGYLWSYYGFNKLHFWGAHLVGGGLAAAGAGQSATNPESQLEGDDNP